MTDKGIHCGHPERPEGNSKVIKWFPGCPQFNRKETT